jgi:hypothetical protein
MLILEIRDAEGRLRPAEVTIATRGERFLRNVPGRESFWSPGRVAVPAPAGEVFARFAGGLRTAPASFRIDLGAGETRTRRVTLRAYGPVRQAGWHLADPVVRLGPGQATDAGWRFETLQDVSLAARAADVALAGLAGAKTLRDGQGRPYGTGAEERARLAADLAEDDAEGFARLVAAIRTAEPEGSVLALAPAPLPPPPPDAGFFDRLESLRDAGALVAWRHPLGRTGPGGDPAGPPAHAFLPATAAGPLYDALVLSGAEEEFRLYTTLLDLGYRLPVIADAGAGAAPGGLDVPTGGAYVRLPGTDWTAAEALGAIRAGAVIATTGPFVRVQVDGFGAGAVLPPSATPREVYVEAIACSDPADDIGAVEVYASGRLLTRETGTREQKELRLRFDTAFREPGWILARYRSTAAEHWAVSAPVYIARDARPGPVAARIRLRLEDAASGARLAGRVRVERGGVTLLERAVPETGLRLEAPATARLHLRAPGHLPRTIDLYRDAGPARAMARLAEEGRLRETLLNPEAYRALREELRLLEVTAPLQPAPPPR